MDLTDEDLMLQAQAELELEQEANASRKPAREPYQLGPDLTSPVNAQDFATRFTNNQLKGVVDMPRATWESLPALEALADPTQGPNDYGKRNWETVGGLAAGTAGAMAGGAAGASLGAPLAPFTFGLSVPLGALLGGGVGFGLGMTGFDVANDATAAASTALTGNDYGGFKPLNEYAQNFAYNSGAGAAGGGVAEIAKAVPAGYRAAKYPFSQERANARVLSELDRQAPGWYDKVNEAFPPEGPPPGGDPFLEYKSLGELVDSPSLKNQQDVLSGSAEQGLGGYGRTAEARRARNDAQLKFLDQLEQGGVTPEQAQAAIQSGVEADLAASQKGVDVAQSGLDSAVSDLPSPIDPSVTGPAMRELIKGSRDAIKGEATAGFEAGKQGIVAPEWESTIAQEKAKYFKDVGEQPNPALAKLLKDLHREGEPILNSEGVALEGPNGPIMKDPTPFTLEDTQAMRSEALRIAQSDGRAAGLANEIARSIKAAEDSALKSGTVTKEQLQSLNEGRALRKEQGDLFQAPNLPGSQVLKSGDYGNGYTTLDSQVPAKVFRSGKGNGGAEAVNNYKEITGWTEQSQNLLYGHIAQDLYRYAWENGKLNPGKLTKWLENNSESLSAVPELKGTLSNLKNAGELLQEKFGNLEQTRADFEKGALSQWLRGKDGVALDPKIAIAKMLADKTGKNLRDTVHYLSGKDPDAVAGLTRGIIDHIKNKVYEPNANISLEEATLPNGPRFDGRVRDALLASEWLKVKEVLENSKRNPLTKSQMQGFDDLYRDKSSQMSIVRERVPGSPTQPKLSTMNAILKKAGSGFLRSVPKFGPYLQLVEPFIAAIPRAKYLAAFEEVLLNPRHARDLQNVANTKNVTKSIQVLFKDELAKAGLVTTATKVAPAVITQNREKKPTVPKQQAVTAKKEFPKPAELLRPPAPGKLKKVSFDTSSLSPETQARIGVESGNDPYAVSPKGAQGLSQLMPDTAQDIAKDLGEQYMPLTANMTPEQRAASLDQNIRFGDYYYNKQLKKFKKPTLAWAAYNAGPKRVEDAMMMAGSTRDVNKILSSLPKGVQKETVPYVNKIMERLTQKG